MQPGLKRDALGPHAVQVASMVPFPRVGRSAGSSAATGERGEDAYPKRIKLAALQANGGGGEKRLADASMLPFPRVGRSSGQTASGQQLVFYKLVGQQGILKIPLIVNERHDMLYSFFLMSVEDSGRL